MVSKAVDVLPSSTERRWKGVRKRAWGRYVCEIRLPRSRQRIWLGSYATAEEAASAYDAASLCLRGTTASLNFPSSPLLLRETASNQLPLSREAIQSIAAAAAARCRHPQLNAVVAEKLPSTCEGLPQKCVKAHTNEDWQSSPTLSDPYTPNQSEETSHWPSKIHCGAKLQVNLEQAGEADEPRVQVSGVPAQQQSSGTDEARASAATGAEDDQCLFSILNLKELVALPSIFNVYEAPIC